MITLGSLELYFLQKKKKVTFKAFKKLPKMVQNEKDLKIVSSRSDHGGKFENEAFELFCEENGIQHHFSAPRTHKKGVV